MELVSQLVDIKQICLTSLYVKVKVTLEQATNVQRRSGDITLLFL